MTVQCATTELIASALPLEYEIIVPDVLKALQHKTQKVKDLAVLVGGNDIKHLPKSRFSSKKTFGDCGVVLNRNVNSYQTRPLLRLPYLVRQTGIC